MHKKTILIGAHVSVEGGLNKAIKRGEEIGATCIQIFTKSNRQWSSNPLTSDEIDEFIKQQKISNIKVVITHAAYLINLGSESDETVQNSIDALVVELQRCESLRIPYLILHPGTMRNKNDELQSLIFTAQQIDKALEIANVKEVTLLLENMAGQGSSIGYTFEQLSIIIKNIDHKEKMGVCLDTAHAFAAGYSFSSISTYEAMIRNFDETIGLERLKVFHINDSKKECGSRVDRHENIGKGLISEKAFELIINDTRFENVPKILETPKGEDWLIADKKNIETLTGYLKK